MVREPARRAGEGDAQGLNGGESNWLAHPLLTTVPRELAPSSGRVQAFWQDDAQRRLHFALGHTVKLEE